MEASNMQAMREALEYVLHFDATDEAAMEDGLTDAERIAEHADHIAECQKKAKEALAAPPRECDMFVDEKQADALHEAFIEYCNGCDCPMGCDYRKNPRFLLDTNCASIMKCFARFALSKAMPKKACAR